MPEFLHKLIDKEEELSINITSMIDVIFILLIFFMVSTQFKKNSLPLDLPECEDTSQEESNKVKVLAVNREEINFDGQSCSIENLEGVLQEAKEMNPELSISLECEKSVDFERVVQILTKVQNSGINRIGIVHEQSE